MKLVTAAKTHIFCSLDFVGRPWPPWPMSFECFESSIERCHQESSRSYPASYQPHLEGHDTPHPCLKMMRLCISGWWLSHPSEKYEFVNGKDDIPYYEMENMKYLKPPTRYIYIYTSKSHPLISFFFFGYLSCFVQGGLSWGCLWLNFSIFGYHFCSQDMAHF